MNFYVLEPEGGLMFGTVQAYADQVDPVILGDDAPLCPRCGRPQNGFAWLLPHRIKLSSARPEKWGDFLWGAANLDDAASRMVRESVKCSFCRSGIIQSWKRVVIEPGSWDGSDIFIPRGLGATILVSQRFKELAETHELKNTLFVPAQNYAYDVKRPGGYYW